MRQISFSGIAALCLAAAAHVPRLFARAAETVSERFWSGIAFFVRTLSYSTPTAMVGGANYTDLTQRHYDEPVQSFLRHESQVSRRSAGRHI